jgi:formylglycine-generating enzyme required for sulfatase activity
LPSVDEWYKAAYHDPVTGVYYDFPTGSDSVPDGIDFAGDTTFDAVYLEGGFNSEPNDITDVGVLSPYGTASQGGNVWEWVETDLDLLNDSVPFGGVRGVRGGSWVNDFSTGLRANYSNLGNPPFDSSNFGFRVANVPEPSSILLLGLALTQGLPQRRRSVR